MNAAVFDFLSGSIGMGRDLKSEIGDDIVEGNGDVAQKYGERRSWLTGR